MWHTRGYMLVSNLLDDVWDEAEYAMREYFPSDHPGTLDFGGISFPTCSALDKITLHKNILKVARECIGQDIMLVQSEAWCKGELGENSDQRMHMDFGNNSFTSPTWSNPEAVAAIVYFDDTRETGGATSVVPYTPTLYPFDAWKRMPGIDLPFANNRVVAEYLMDVHGHGAFRRRLYDAEVNVRAKRGDVLFYRHDLWHRGTPVYPGRTRRVMNLVFKKTECHHIYNWGHGFARGNYRGHVESVVRALSDDQRTVLGIPKGRCRL